MWLIKRHANENSHKIKAGWYLDANSHVLTSKPKGKRQKLTVCSSILRASAVLLMMPLSGAPPEDKNTVSRADNSKSENFFRFLGTLAFSSDSSSIFSLLHLTKKNQMIQVEYIQLHYVSGFFLVFPPVQVLKLFYFFFSP